MCRLALNGCFSERPPRKQPFNPNDPWNPLWSSVKAKLNTPSHKEQLKWSLVWGIQINTSRLTRSKMKHCSLQKSKIDPAERLGCSRSRLGQWEDSHRFAARRVPPVSSLISEQFVILLMNDHGKIWPSDVGMVGYFPTFVSLRFQKKIKVLFRTMQEVVISCEPPNPSMGGVEIQLCKVTSKNIALVPFQFSCMNLVKIRAKWEQRLMVSEVRDNVWPFSRGVCRTLPTEHESKLCAKKGHDKTGGHSLKDTSKNNPAKNRKTERCCPMLDTCWGRNTLPSQHHPLHSVRSCVSRDWTQLLEEQLQSAALVTRSCCEAELTPWIKWIQKARGRIVRDQMQPVFGIDYLLDRASYSKSSLSWQDFSTGLLKGRLRDWFSNWMQTILLLWRSYMYIHGFSGR